MMDDAVSRLRQEVVEPLKRRFVGRDEVVDLIALAVTAGEHLFLHGPPGTAKSALIRQFATAVRGQLLRISADPVLRAQRGLRSDRPGPAPRGDGGDGHHRDAAGGGVRLPGRAVQCQQRDPEQPADRAQRADLPAGGRGPPAAVALAVRGLEPPARGRSAGRLFDRFLLRCHVDNLRREEMPRLLAAGWELEQAGPIESSVVVGRPSRAVAARSIASIWAGSPTGMRTSCGRCATWGSA